MTLNATITIPQQSCLPVQVQWDFGDGNLGPIITYNSSGTFSLSINHTYSPGNYNAQLLILTPIGCPIQSISITVPPCPTTCCPVISTNVSIGDCNSNGDFVATFTTTITVNQGCPSAVVQWNYGDGNNGTAQSFGQGTSTFTDTYTYNVNSSPPPPYTATLNVISPSGCTSSSVIINAPNTNACNCKTTFLSWFCPLLFGVMTFGLGLALICILLATCPGLSTIANGLLTAAAVFAALAVVALVIYLIFCRNCVPCGWLFLLLWRIFFGAGIIYAIFAGCCGGLTAFLIGLGVMIVGILFLILWANQCGKTLCQVLAEVILTLAVYILPAIAFLLTNFGILSACLFVVFTILNIPVTFLLIVTIINAYIVAYYLSNC